MKRTCNNCVEFITWEQNGKVNFKCREGRLGTSSWTGTGEFNGCSKHRFDYETPPPDTDSITLQLRHIEKMIDTLDARVNSYNRVMRKLSKHLDGAE